MEYSAAVAATGHAPTIAFQSFLRRTFLWMTAGLAVTGGVAGILGSSDRLLNYINDNPAVVIVLFVVQLGVVIAISAAINRISVPVAIGLFFFYAATMGVLFAAIFQLYTPQSIFTAFVITGGMFGAMATYGYVTKADLSKLGSILFMALIGLILASVVNLFVANSALYWITTYAGVAIFAGLTAYDMQKLRKFGEAGFADEQAESRASILGALALYLDFVNLFLFLLRIFGSSR